ncbi:CDF family Co(II)/Ni(II) efflux transporter DmeF [Dongia mobilis]|jgi:cation diffusion facilitator family transporter|uniref:CDF family Co(II)/Ni(II) efflux transporter DmeF n=1 Tax=Dongia sp. TaxID=1977262 RepID=UPI0026EDFF1D
MNETLNATQKSHDFRGASHARNARRVRIVLLFSCAMMVGEIAAGHFYGSMALLADGWHMATHLAALGISLLAYTFAERQASNARFSFGTGKFGDLGAYTSAVVLAIVALGIGYEAVDRFLNPTSIRYAEAMAVAALGLTVNIVAALLLQEDHGHDHHGHGHDQGHAHAHDHTHAHDHGHDHHKDLNLRSAYVHMLADAATSVLAMAAIGCGWMFGWAFLDPVIGLVGAAVILRWAYLLMKSSGATLLDAQPNIALTEAIRAEIEALGDRVTDLHVWRVGPGHLAGIVSIATTESRDVDFYRAALTGVAQLSHLTIEVEVRPEV